MPSEPKIGDEFEWMAESDGQWSAITETVCDVIGPVDGGWLVEYAQPRIHSVPPVFTAIPDFGAPRVLQCVIVNRDGRWVHEATTPTPEAE